jgi:two-component system, chemotaxis family, protein-glutamate methylesterase/glutaminase
MNDRGNVICKVLVVDDSAYIRKVFSEILQRSPSIEVVATARDGHDALDKVIEYQPDVVVLDLFMPRLDGVGFLREQMRRKTIPVVVCSSADEDEQPVIAAMEAGAIEFVRKPTAQSIEQVTEISVDLVRKVLATARIAPGKIDPQMFRPVVQCTREAPALDPVRNLDVVLIGLSTGGPQALRYLLPQLPENFPLPVAIVLHMPPGYTRSFAERLHQLCKIQVVEAGEGLEMKPGRVILAKAGYHLMLVRDHTGTVICHLNQSSLMDTFHRPSVDVLFRSAASIYGSKTLAIVLTGMGDDGTIGAAWVKANGGIVFSESEETSVIYGMPYSVKEAGLSDKIIPLHGIIDAIMELIT